MKTYLVSLTSVDMTPRIFISRLKYCCNRPVSSCNQRRTEFKERSRKRGRRLDHTIVSHLHSRRTTQSKNSFREEQLETRTKSSRRASNSIHFPAINVTCSRFVTDSNAVLWLANERQWGQSISGTVRWVGITFACVIVPSPTGFAGNLNLKAGSVGARNIESTDLSTAIDEKALRDLYAKIAPWRTFSSQKEKQWLEHLLALI